MEEEEEKQQQQSEKPKLVSLNPLPPERLLRGSSERSETTQGEEDGEASASSSESTETNASINGDVEDNLQGRRQSFGIGCILQNAESLKPRQVFLTSDLPILFTDHFICSL